jgi:serine/threonine-protein kinase
MALGNCYYYGDRDYERALQEYAIARRGLPNEPRIFMAIGAIERRQGKWNESIANMKKAAILDPKNANVRAELSETYSALQDFPAAADSLDQAIAAAPDSFFLKLRRAFLDLEWKGYPTALEKTLASAPVDTTVQAELIAPRAYLKVLQKNYDEAVRIVLQSSQDRLQIDFGVSTPKDFLLGRIYFAAKDYEKAKSYFEAARPAIEASVAENPSEWTRHALLGELYAGIGRKEDAVGEGKRAVELLPESIDAFDGPKAITMLAQIYAMLGDADAALPLIEHVLSAKTGISVQALRDPVWDRIRGDPRFQTLLTKYGVSS